MAKKKIPTVEELRAYHEELHAHIEDCISNKKTFVITGAQFQGEGVWVAKGTLPLMEAAEAVGAPKEEIWALCSKFATFSTAPITKKHYERMIPFSQKPATVDTVLKYLETYIPKLDDLLARFSFDRITYYYCCALISLSDYRKEDCEKRLWDIVHYFIENDEDRGVVLLRNMKMLGSDRPFLLPMKEKLEEAQKKDA